MSDNKERNRSRQKARSGEQLKDLSHFTPRYISYEGPVGT